MVMEKSPWNVGQLLPDCAAQNPRGQSSSAWSIVCIIHYAILI
jgi:hypothetical protein